MLLRKHPSARCPWCGGQLCYGLKEEANSWKIEYACTENGCGREFSPGLVPRSDVDSEDNAYERAEKLGTRLY